MVDVFATPSPVEVDVIGFPFVWTPDAVATLTISLIALVISIIALVAPMIANRQSLRIAVVRYGLFDQPKHSDDPDLLVVLAIFTNGSRLPLSITEVSFAIDGTEYVFEQSPSILFVHERNNEPDGYEDSTPFPINLAPLEGRSVYLYAGIQKDTFPRASTPLTFEVQTSRHRTAKTLSVSRDAAQELEDFLSPDRLDQIPDSRRNAPVRYSH